MEREIITAILYTELNDEVGPNPLIWYPESYLLTDLLHISIKTITILSGEHGLIPESIVILPFPSLKSKGLIKYIKWDDEERRGGIGQSAITLLFKEFDDVIFYKYLKHFDPPFNEAAQHIINLEKERAGEESIRGIIKHLENTILNLIEELKNKEISQSAITEFPQQKLKDEGLIDYKFKIIIVGDPGVGKTSLILRFTNNAFRRTYIPTLGVHVSDKVFQVENSNVQLVLWDIAGQVKFEMMRQQFYLGSDGIFLIFDLTKPQSFDSLSNWFHDVKKQLKNRPELIGFIIGNKSDLMKERTIQPENANELASSLNLGYIETSALTGSNVENAFFNIANQLYKSIL